MKSVEIKSAVSVVIPAYNAETFINEAIDSVLKQTVQPLEILVINDGSMDQTVQIVEAYPPPVRLLSQNNVGVSAARNRGIYEAKSEFIAFLDADDVFIEPTKLEKQLKIISEKNCDIVMSGWQVTDEKLNRISNRCAWQEISHNNLFNWVTALPILPSVMLLRRTKLLEIQGFDVNITNSEDIDLMFRMALNNCLIEWLPEITTAYRRHFNNATNHVRRQLEGILAVDKKLFQHPDTPPSVLEIEPEIHYQRLIWAAFHFFLADDMASMKECLLDSRNYSDIASAGFLADWFYRFNTISSDHNQEEFDVCKLLNSNEWMELEKLLFNDG